jgi:hypothetical protein
LPLWLRDLHLPLLAQRRRASCQAVPPRFHP